MSNAAQRAPRWWFIPRPGYDGPPIELTCGWHDKNGKFHPKHVKSPPRISRLRTRGRYRIKMAGDPSTDEREI